MAQLIDLFPVDVKVQNNWLQDVLLWYVDYFELDSIKTLQVHEKFFTFSSKNLN